MTVAFVVAPLQYATRCDSCYDGAVVTLGGDVWDLCATCARAAAAEITRIVDEATTWTCPDCHMIMASGVRNQRCHGAINEHATLRRFDQEKEEPMRISNGATVDETT